MIMLTVAPKSGENLFRMLQQREVELRRHKQGTLHRIGARVKNQEKWGHVAYKGKITFQKGLGGSLVALVESREDRDEWQLLTSFVGFLHRHFRESISNITMTYADE
jgi:hypothetical protein